jgi:hypothetical protein
VDGGRERQIDGIGEMNRRRDMCWETKNARRDRRDLAGVGDEWGGSVTWRVDPPHSHPDC